MPYCGLSCSTAVGGSMRQGNGGRPCSGTLVEKILEANPTPLDVSLFTQVFLSLMFYFSGTCSTFTNTYYLKETVFTHPKSGCLARLLGESACRRVNAETRTPLSLQRPARAAFHSCVGTWIWGAFPPRPHCEGGLLCLELRQTRWCMPNPLSSWDVVSLSDFALHSPLVS